jgi:hypothetical protein
MQEFNLVLLTEPLDALASLDAPRRTGGYQALTFTGWRIGAAVTEDASGVYHAVRLYATAESKIVVAYDRRVAGDAGVAGFEFSDDEAEFASTHETLPDAEEWLLEQTDASLEMVTSVIRAAQWVMKNEREAE